MNLKFVRNIHGDEANYGYRSIWENENGKRVLRKEYYDKNKIKTIDNIKSNLKNKMPIDIAFPITENISDGYHSFKELYYQRTLLFATICNSYPNLSWKTKKQSDETNCCDGFFIAGIDTPEGNFTYHCENEYWNLFKISEIYKSKWDGHTEKDVTRLLSL